MPLDMSSADDAKKKAAATYNAAADFYDYPTNTFWERYGRRTIEPLQLRPENLCFIRTEGIRSVEANVLYAQASV